MANPGPPGPTLEDQLRGMILSNITISGDQAPGPHHVPRGQQGRYSAQTLHQLRPAHPQFPIQNRQQGPPHNYHNGYVPQNPPQAQNAYVRNQSSNRLYGQQQHFEGRFTHQASTSQASRIPQQHAAKHPVTGAHPVGPPPSNAPTQPKIPQRHNTKPAVAAVHAAPPPPGNPPSGLRPQILQRPPAPPVGNSATLNAPTPQVPRPPQAAPRPPQLPRPDVLQAQCAYLDRLVALEVPRAEMTSAEKEEKQAFRSRIEAICQRAVSEAVPNGTPHVSLQSFGSLGSGLATHGSDVDLGATLLATPSDPSSQILPVPRWLPRLMEQALLQHGYGAHLLTQTRVPILKVCEKPSPELYAALCEERQKWEVLPDEEKYPDPVKVNQKRNEDIAKAEAAKAEAAKAVADRAPAEKAKPLFNDGDFPSLGTQKGAAKPVQAVKKPQNGPSDTAPNGTITPQSTKVGNSDTVNDGPVNVAAPEPVTNGDPPDTTTDSQPPQASTPTATPKPPTTPLRPPRPEKTWLREKPLGPLDFPKTGIGIQSDINFSNPLGVHNTRLLRCYLACDTRVKPFILFIKLWASSRKINSARNGTLCSYGYALLALHYLMNVARPAVVPNLQNMQLALFTVRGIHANLTNRVVGGHLVAFWDDEEALAKLAASGQGAGFHWMEDVLSLRTAPGGLLSKRAKEWTGARTQLMEDGLEVRQRFLLAIEDPFEWSHNVGRTVTHRGIVAIRDEFRRAWRILQGLWKGEEALVEGLLDPVREEVRVAGTEKEKEKESEDKGEDKSEEARTDEPSEEKTGKTVADEAAVAPKDSVLEPATAREPATVPVPEPVPESASEVHGN
ncbi:hypothetical protein H2199_000567 [Coniosporium tulheliwenetii]|uniref:Uncharacterized protein n=1 Tax=Coniosporium tulheliwenetii TaxID=3383036 RepID=A0ACC2ZQI4_9PEZI|nr:hypothetical protein H2199_000567 [Cladosporium sp. JES 115]